LITIVNYGLGNIAAFVNVYKRLNVDVKIAQTAAELRGAERIILPGVGAFDHAMDMLNASGMREPLDDLVLGGSTPVLGVCVGMQILADESDECTRRGLGWIPGMVRSFASASRSATLPLPHMGWNDVTPMAGDLLFRNLTNGARFYFLHSYFFDCSDVGQVEATAQYGVKFSCGVRSGNIHGVQFHPEKSHHFGVSLLKNFSEI
jgi:glutamine amidotransferase